MERLSADERRVLEVLVQPDRRVADCTADVVASAAGTTEPVSRVLRRLETRKPQLVQSDVDEGLGIRFWRTTPNAADAMENEK